MKEHLLLAMTEVIETSSMERQSIIITIILRHQISHIVREVFPSVWRPYGWLALCIDPMEGIMGAAPTP